MGAEKLYCIHGLFHLMIVPSQLCNEQSFVYSYYPRGFLNCPEGFIVGFCHFPQPPVWSLEWNSIWTILYGLYSYNTTFMEHTNLFWHSMHSHTAALWRWSEVAPSHSSHRYQVQDVACKRSLEVYGNGNKAIIWMCYALLISNYMLIGDRCAHNCLPKFASFTVWYAFSTRM